MIVRLKERLVKVFVDYDQAHNLAAANSGPQVSFSLTKNNPIPAQAIKIPTPPSTTTDCDYH